MRTLKELAQEALQVQDACNLSGVVRSWSKAITALRAIMPSADTQTINRHPINKMWADKCLSLTGVTVLEDIEAAIEWCKEHSK